MYVCMYVLASHLGVVLVPMQIPDHGQVELSSCSPKIGPLHAINRLASRWPHQTYCMPGGIRAEWKWLVRIVN